MLPAHISKNSQRTEGHIRLNLYSSVTNYRLVCEIRVTSLAPVSSGKALCRAERWSPAAEELTGAAILNESQRRVCCYQLLFNMLFINLKLLYLATEKGMILFSTVSLVCLVSRIRHWTAKKTKFVSSCLLLDHCLCYMLKKTEVLGAGAWGIKGYMVWHMHKT